ncbi:MAG: OprO/OprP family phosphate-selective porin [Myxococcales bacterium]|nr:OprO/OprP family phosphate-selective porin [Myxococcales bacterium]
MLAVFCAALSAREGRAQQAERAVPAPTDPAPASPDVSPVPGADLASELAALKQELERQRAQTSEQQRRLDAQQAELDALAAQAADAESAELAAIEESVAVEELAQPEPLRLYGFMDAGFSKMWVSREALVGAFLPTPSTTFVLGNVNLYLDARPTRDFRGLAEVRFTNLPHGEERAFATPMGGEYERVDLEGINVTSPDGRDRLIFGSTVLERAFVEWSGTPELHLRVGQWLTPFGIWNVDHGTPVLISLLQPDFQIRQIFPGRQVGIQALGELPVGGWSLGYRFYVSNGRLAGQFDIDDDKALGGRLVLERSASTRTAIGLSAYYGSFEDYERAITSFNPFRTERRITVARDELVVGTDLSIDAGAFRFRGEVVLGHRAYEEGKRLPVRAAGPNAWEADGYTFGGYILGAYQLPFWGLEPYLYLESNHRASVSGDTNLGYGPGLNVYFTPEVQWKTMFAVYHFLDLEGEALMHRGDPRLAIFTSRFVLAF